MWVPEYAYAHLQLGDCRVESHHNRELRVRLGGEKLGCAAGIGERGTRLRAPAQQCAVICSRCHALHKASRIMVRQLLAINSCTDGGCGFVSSVAVDHAVPPP